MFTEFYFRSSSPITFLVCLLLSITVFQVPGNCDLIKLKAGGEIRGKLQRHDSDSDEIRIIETLSGSRIAVAARQIEFVTNRPLSVEEYETRSRQISDTVQEHLELAEWCSENHLISQRHEELEKVLLLDPDHAKARAALGYTNRDGEWMTRDDVMRKNGYIKYKGRYVSTAELELLEKNEADIAEERKWFKKIKLWLTLMMSSRSRMV